MIIFDTETTGLIDNSAKPLKEQPQIIELFCLKLHDETFEEDGAWLSRFHVKKIQPDAIKTHGITVADLAMELTFAERFDSLCDFFLGQRILVGHNISFDIDMLDMEVKRLGKSRAFPWPYRHIDTVEATEGEDGFRLGLAVLHERLFNESFEGAHGAEADVRATARCLVELIKQGLVKL